MIPRTPLGARLVRAYCLALGIITALAIASHVLARGIIEGEARAATVLGLAGEQSMLAQRIAMLAAKLALPEVPDGREALRDELAASRDRLHANHRVLVEGDPVRDLPPPGQEKMRAIYSAPPYELDRLITRFHRLSGEVLVGLPGEIDRTTLVALLAMANAELPDALDEATARYENEVIAGIARLALFQKICLAGMGLTLAGIAFGIFAPTIRRVEAEAGELEAALHAMEHNALHDPLTGLPNRRYLSEHLERVLANAGRSGQTVGLLHLDLDRFKEVNDTLGHAAGDAVLVAATKRMLASVRTSDFVARTGGDEFVIVSPSVNSVDGLGILASRLIEGLADPIPYEGSECRIGTSVGIALARPGAALHAERLVMNADLALYAAKNEGRGVYRFFDGDDRAKREDAPAQLALAGE